MVWHKGFYEECGIFADRGGDLALSAKEITAKSKKSKKLKK
jgi:hypothetical protein